MVKNGNHKLHALSLAVTLSLINSAFAAKEGPTPYWVCQANNQKWQCKQILRPGTDLYQPPLTHKAKITALANALGWVAETSLSPTHSVCGGYYYEPTLQMRGPNVSFKNAQSKIDYESASYQLKGVATFNHVLITQPNRTLYADKATLFPQKNTERLQAIEAKGHIRFTQPNVLMLGTQGEANLENHKAYLNDVYYLIKVRPDWLSETDENDRNFTGYAHGHADTIHQNSQSIFVLKNTNYTTCPPGSDTWQLSAKKIVLDQQKEEGSASNTVLRIKGVPVFYLPYFSFPLSGARKSGVLFGAFSSSTASGLAFSLPYYFNLAPNYDDTLTTTFYTKRGVLLSNEFRYLTHFGTGYFKADVIPHDSKAGGTRAQFSWQNQSYFDPNWQSKIDYNYITDNQFLQDFGSGPNIYTSNLVLLNRSASINYSDPHASLTGLVQYYQVINPLLTTQNRPYNRLPEVDLTLQYPNVYHFLNVNFNSQFVDFQKITSEGGPAVNSQRLSIIPEISIPLYQSYGFIIPTIALNTTTYFLQNRVNQISSMENETNQFPDQSIIRTLPIFDLNAGLYFDKKLKINGRTYTQTLEPRIYYLYVPYRNQNNIPIFDTSINNFTYNSLFQTNIFSGLDRISNANQLSFALQTNIHNSEGVQKLNAGLGEIVYFQKPRVSLCSSLSPNCDANSQLASYDQPHSDLAGFAGYYLNPNWNVSANLLFNTFTNRFDLQNYQLQYRADNRHIFNFGYQYNANDFALLSTQDLINGQAPLSLSQLTTSGIWPITSKWSLMAQWNYSLNSHHTIDSFGGFEYDSCCWRVRFILQRYITNSDPNTPYEITGPLSTSYMVQFELKGLGSTDSSQIQSLLAAIPGYQLS